MDIHYINYSLLSERMAHNVARTEMAKAFSRVAEVSHVYFYVLMNKRKDIYKLKQKLPDKVHLRHVFSPGYKISDERPASLFRKLVYKFYFLKYVSKILFMRFKKEDFIFARDLGGVLPLYMRSFLGLSYSFEIHNYEFGKNIFSDFCYRRLMKRASYVVTVSKFTKKNWVKHGIDPKKILVLPSGVDVKSFDISLGKKEARKKLDLPLDKKILVYTGHLYEWKGVDTLIDSMKTLGEDYLLCIVGGKHNDILKMKRYSDNIELTNVLFFGQKEHDEVVSYLKAADVVVLPNSGRFDISKYHTSPIKLYEYISSKRPVVASRLASIEQAVSEDEVWFFNPDDASDLAYVVKKVLHRSSRSKIEKAYKMAKECSWDKRAEKIVGCLKAR